MRQITATRRTRYLQLGMPAAVLGTLAGTLVAAPAQAASAAAIEPHRSAQARVVPAQVPPSSYQAQPGDTVWAIAERFGLRTGDLLAWNGLSSRSVIHPGQTLTLRTPAAASASAPAPVRTTASSHTVAAGDTVYAIAQKHGTTVDAVLAANGLTKASIIYPGQKLVLAEASAATTAPAAAPVAPVTAAASATHTVVAGDTVFGIAQKHGTTPESLFALNGLSSSSVIYPGQKLAVRAKPAAEAASVSGQRTAALTAEQASNAARIIRIGRELGVSDRGIAIALATGMVESSLRNLHGGDRDSLGVFQQRPSMGWGTPDQIMDADRSTRVFYGGQSDPNGQATRGLLDIPGWESMSFTDAAQAVQISAYPTRYGQWETQAYAWLGLHG